MTLREIAALHIYNVKQFLKNGYMIHADPFIGLYVPSPVIIVWVLQIVLFIPMIVIWPLCKTIVDLFTRNPLSIDERKLINSTISNLSSESFDEFTKFEALDEVLFQSENSRELIKVLKTKPCTEYKVEIPRTEDAGLLRALEVFEECYKELTKDGCFLEEIPPYEPKYITKQYTPEEYLEQKQLHRKRTCEAIEAYIHNPENNGTKLMQYLHTNILHDALSPESRQNYLKLKVSKEIARLQEKGITSQEKARQITEVVSQPLLDEKKLSATLSINCGYGRFFGLESTMTQAYTNVYCKPPQV